MVIFEFKGNARKRQLPWSGYPFASKKNPNSTFPQVPPNLWLMSTPIQQQPLTTPELAPATQPAMLPLTSSHLRTPPPEQLPTLPGPPLQNGPVRSAARSQRKNKNASSSSRKPRHVPAVDIRPKPSKFSTATLSTELFSHKSKQQPRDLPPRFEPDATSNDFDPTVEQNLDDLYLWDPIPELLPTETYSHHNTHLGYYHPTSGNGDLTGTPQTLPTWQPQQFVPSTAAQPANMRPTAATTTGFGQPSMAAVPNYGPPLESPYDFGSYQQQPQHQLPVAGLSQTALDSEWQGAILQSGLFDHTQFASQSWATYNEMPSITNAHGESFTDPMGFTSWHHQQPTPATRLPQAQAHTPPLTSFPHQVVQPQTPPGTATTAQTVSPRDIFKDEFPQAPLRTQSNAQLSQVGLRTFTGSRHASEDEPMINTSLQEQSQLYHRGRGQLEVQQPLLHRPSSTSSFTSMLRANERLMEASEDGSVSGASVGGGFNGGITNNHLASLSFSTSDMSARRQLPTEPRSSRARYAFVPGDEVPQYGEDDSDDADSPSQPQPGRTSARTPAHAKKQTSESGKHIRANNEGSSSRPGPDQPSQAPKRGPPGPATETFPSGRLPTGASSAVENLFIHEMREEGLSFREIQGAGPFVQAESTLRGRYRTYVTDKALRPRKALWTPDDDVLLWEAVRHYRRIGRHSRSDQIPWQKVRDHIYESGGTHKFWSANCHKRWKMLRDERLEARVRGGGVGDAGRQPEYGNERDTKAGYSLSIYNDE